MSEVSVPEEAIEAAAREAVEHFEMPFMARVRDFTREQVEAGELRVADAEADRKNRAAVEAVVRAAAPLIVAAELSDYARDLKAQAEALGEPRIDTPASAIVQVLKTLADDFETRASVLRGEGQKDD